MTQTKTQAKTIRRTVEVLEYAQSGKAHKVDRDTGVIHDVKILGRVSRNGPRYSPSAITGGRDLYEGASIFLNHPRGRPDEERKMEDQFGWLERVHESPDGIYGDLHYVKSHPMAGPVAELAERRPDKFGLSHNAVCSESTRGTDRVYESINRVRSVDLVCSPATTRGIFESEENSTMGDELAGVPSDPVADAGGGSGDMTWDLFISKAKEIYDGSGDAGGKATAIGKLARELFKLGDKIDEAAASASDSSSDSGGGGEAQVSESAKPVKDAFLNAVSVLESAGVPVTSQRVKLVAALSGDATNQAALVETWKSPKSAGARPRSTGTLANVTESTKPAVSRKDEFDAAFHRVMR